MSADRVAAARRALALMDLTDLSDDCTPEAIDELCARAVGPFGTVAAVCVWPRFVAQARQQLVSTGVQVATVVNFPAGRDEVIETLRLTEGALADGADEIDLVLPYHAVQIGDLEKAETMVRSVAELAHAQGGRLKVILEAGALGDASMIKVAAQLAIAGGADFIKTSTGKIPVSATPEAVRVMLDVIADADRPVGLKPSGGIRTLDDALVYLTLADEVLGAGWATPQTFRFGASGLLDALEAEIAGDAGASSDAAY
jgi:deoxyribose-phosphate aldolase